MRRAGLLAGLLALASVPPAPGQSVIRGSVRADSSLRPVSGASIALGTLGRAATTDAAGSFAIDGLPAGRFAVAIRAVGYRPLELVAELTGLDTLEVDIAMTPMAQTIAPLTITAAASPRSGRLADFERRRQAGFGHFFDRATLAEMESHRISDLLRLVSGLHLVPLPWSCNLGMAVASGRRGDTPLPVAMYCGGVEPRRACYVDVYVDGAVRWRFGEGPPLPIDQFAVREFQAVEVYRGRSELPIEFTRGEPACGAIVLWTRTGDP